MKLTLTREQIHDARDTLIWIRTGAQMSALTGGFPAYAERTPGSREFHHLKAWADALEAAIAEAEAPMQVITLAKQGDADERAFWREAFTLDYAQPSSWCGADRARYSVQAADVALAGYRAAFCTGMPSDQKGAK